MFNFLHSFSPTVYNNFTLDLEKPLYLRKKKKGTQASDNEKCDLHTNEIMCMFSHIIVVKNKRFHDVVTKQDN